jgi:hypothetical protein
MKTLGQAPVRLVLYPGEGHGNRRAASRYDYSAPAGAVDGALRRQVKAATHQPYQSRLQGPRKRLAGG